ncbi:hypothetical protein C3F00_033685 [Pseudomonas sp. MWU13-2860]|nr:hypothetical protein C3F00_033685 [Pseudomonas sp. MWU13-2860]
MLTRRQLLQTGLGGAAALALAAGGGPQLVLAPMMSRHGQSGAVGGPRAVALVNVVFIRVTAAGTML